MFQERQAKNAESQAKSSEKEHEKELGVLQRDLGQCVQENTKLAQKVAISHYSNQYLHWYS